MMHSVILIPAYKPDEKFVVFAKSLIDEGKTVLAVDDGSGEEHKLFFDEVKAFGVHVLHHSTNLGKGCALRNGITEICKMFPNVEAIVTADCDGQHSLHDINKIIDAMETNPNTLIIGGRFQNKDEKVPIRSFLGNSVTRIAFILATGVRIHDTQTGLRGLPACILPQLEVLSGDRYEYEMNMLLKIKEWEIKYKEIPIQTIYINDNKGSHYDTFKDSWRIFKQIFKFCGASVLSMIFDYLIYILLLNLFDSSVSRAYIIARIFSAVFNYLLNSRLVFKKSGLTHFVKYAILAVCIMFIGAYGAQWLSNEFNFSDLLCKIFIDLPLFVVSFVVQREAVFNKKKLIKKGKSA